MTTARSARTAQLAALMSNVAAPDVRTSHFAVLAAYAPPSTKFTRTSEAAMLLVGASEAAVSIGTTQVAMLVSYGIGVPDPSRQRAWTMVLDGHTFYVLDLGAEGTFLYDTTTKQWCKFSTLGFDQWNVANGVMWGDRIVGGDLLNDQVWEVVPTAVLDEGWRDIEHIVTGGLQTRSRVFLAVDAVRLNASIGQLDEVNGATLSLQYSDNQGLTFSDAFTIALTQGDYGGEIAWRSLGSFAAPGRIFKITDVGGLIRIDGADGFIDGFDDEKSAGEQAPGQGG